MSHVAAVALEITDLDSLEDACKMMGLELVRGQQTYKWYGTHVGDYPIPDGFTKADMGRCEHAIRIPGNSQAYEIGVVKNRNGQPGYTLLWDFWGGGFGMQAKVGKEGGLLKQSYSIARAQRHAKKMGHKTKIVKKQNGYIQLIAF